MSLRYEPSFDLFPNRWASSCTPKNVIHIHFGRAQYKNSNAPVLSQDAPPDVTFLLWSTLGAMDRLPKQGRLQRYLVHKKHRLSKQVGIIMYLPEAEEDQHLRPRITKAFKVPEDP